VLDGDPAPPPSKRPSSQFLAHICYGQMAAWIKMPLTRYGGRPRPRRLFVRWGPRSSPPKGGGDPKFSAHVYCGQTAGWIKMAFGMEVGLSPGDFVLDGNPASPSPKEAEPSCSFRLMSLCLLRPNGFLLWPNGWMDQDGTWHGGRPHPRRLCVRWVPSSPVLKRGGAPSPIFGPCLLWPNSFIYGFGLSDLLPENFCIVHTR